MLDFQQKKQLSILIKIAMVDEEFADSERQMIQKIAQNYGASHTEINQIFEAPSINESLAPMAVTEKMDFMMDCMLVILADNVVTKSEEAFAHTMASKLGFNRAVIPFLIENKTVSRQQMKERLIDFLV